jgi:hypothetical protein
MAAKKLSQAEPLAQEHMLAVLERASDRPDAWHKIEYLDATRKADELLAKRGVIEVWPETGCIV